MKKIIGISFLSIFLMGCITYKPLPKDFYFSESIGSNPYQHAGGYVVDGRDYVRNIFIHRRWIERIYKSKYYLEIVFKKPVWRERPIFVEDLQ